LSGIGFGGHCIGYRRVWLSGWCGCCCFELPTLPMSKPLNQFFF
jgi:hypothetical protein